MKNHGIIAHSPTIGRTPNSLRYRIVLRDLGGEWVVHTQVFHDDAEHAAKFGPCSFNHGEYFRKDGRRETFAGAWDAFKERASRHVYCYQDFMEGPSES